MRKIIRVPWPGGPIAERNSAGAARVLHGFDGLTMIKFPKNGIPGFSGHGNFDNSHLCAGWGVAPRSRIRPNLVRAGARPARSLWKMSQGCGSQATEGSYPTPSMINRPDFSGTSVCVDIRGEERLCAPSNRITDPGGAGLEFPAKAEKLEFLLLYPHFPAWQESILIRVEFFFLAHKR